MFSFVLYKNPEKTYPSFITTDFSGLEKLKAFDYHHNKITLETTGTFPK